jgi:hypothetical protein
MKAVVSGGANLRDGNNGFGVIDLFFRPVVLANASSAKRMAG